MQCNNCLKEIYEDGGIWRHVHSDMKMCGNIAEPLIEDPLPIDISICPDCGGPADNGFSREIPPSPYSCTKCDSNLEK